MARSLSKQVGFRPLARTVVMLGEQMISDEFVAISELVKNAFDADAECVRIVIDNATSTIVIEDDGTGMSEDDVLLKWLVPATVSKTMPDGKKKRTGKGRISVGGKGIGRFAVHRLGHELLLETKTELSAEATCLRIDWDAYEDPKAYLDEISHEMWLSADGVFAKGQGTRLTISRIRCVWNEARADALRDAIVKLFSSSTGFSVSLVVDGRVVSMPEGRPRYEAELNEIHPEWTLQGVADMQGRFHGTLNGLGCAFPTESGSSCGPVTVFMSVLERSNVQKTRQDARMARVSALQDEVQGILIYRDGCRVYPYGNPGNDWLELDTRRISEIGTRLANKQILAFVDITSDGNPALIDKTNREGLIENEAYHSLKRVLMSCIHTIEITRLKRNRQVREGQPSEARIRGAIAVAKQAEGPSRGAALKELETVVVDEIRHKEERLRTMATLSGIGLAAEKSTHEITRLIKQLSESLHSAMAVVDRLIATRADAGTTDLKEHISRSMEYAQLLQAQLRGLTPLYKVSRARKQLLDAEPVVEKALAWYKSDLVKAGIAPTVQVLSPLTIEENEGLIMHVLMNLIDNAVYWLQKTPPPRTLSFIVDGRARTINVIDNGPGVIPGEEEAIFEPLVSRKENGRGLGLYIAQELLEQGGHRIRAKTGDESLEPVGADFEITFR